MFEGLNRVEKTVQMVVVSVMAVVVAAVVVVVVAAVVVVVVERSQAEEFDVSVMILEVTLPSRIVVVMETGMVVVG